MASAREFVQSPSIEALETFKKDMLLNIAKELQLEVKRSTLKHELKRLIVEQLVDEDLLPESCLDVYKLVSMEPSGQIEIKRLEIEFKMKELEAQQRKEELEAQQRKEELKAQQQKEELKAQLEARGSQQKAELEAQLRKEELALAHEREMKALELNVRKIAHEESIATKFDLPKKCATGTTIQ